MITMHYSFTLPADYDMTIIQRRISDNGHKLNGFPDLVFKAYLYAFKNAERHQSNQYAPLYLWQSHEGISRFLSTSGYKQLESDFGRPTIQYAIPIATFLSDDRLSQALFCKKEVIAIPRNTDIADLIQEESKTEEEINDTHGEHLVGLISTLNPDQWLLTRWSLFAKDLPIEHEHTRNDTQWFHVGYLSQ